MRRVLEQLGAATSCGRRTETDRSGRAHRLVRGALRSGQDHARLGAGARAAAGPPRPGSRLACPAAAPSASGRSTSTSRRWPRWAPRSRWSTATSRPRRTGLRGAKIKFPGRTRHRHREPDDGRGAGRGDHGAGQLRPGAGGRRSGRPAERDGRVDPAAPGRTRSSIEGRDELGGAEHAVIPDRIEAGTYLVAGALVGDKVEVANCRPGPPRAGAAAACATRASRSRWRATACASRRPSGCTPRICETAPHPGYPTDMQAQYMALMTQAEGSVADHRDDLRAPLHARRRAAAHGRRHPHRRTHLRRRRAAAADRGPGHGDRPARLGLPGAGGAGRRRASRWSTASTTWTAATRRWKTKLVSAGGFGGEDPMSDCLFCKIVGGGDPRQEGLRGRRSDRLPRHQPAGAGPRPGRPAPPHRLPGRRRRGGRGAAGPDPAGCSGDLARELGVESGYRVVNNCGAPAGQSVFHIHFHLLGGRPPGLAPG